MTSIDRLHGVSARSGDLLVCGEFSYDADNGARFRPG